MAKTTRPKSRSRSGQPAMMKSGNDPIAVLAAQPFCDYPDVSHLTPSEQAALHAFLHQVLASGFSLYERVPAKKAAPLIVKILEQVLKQIGSPTDP